MKHSSRFTCIKYCIGVVLFAVQIEAEQCITPNHEKAECISLYSCPILLNALIHNKIGAIEFVSKSNTCGGTTTNPLVCCGSSSEFRPLHKLNYDLLPGKEYCGLQHSDEYVRPTNATSINEFPWVARIKYRHAQNKSMTTKYKCSGTLIHPRYVLTNAYCLETDEFIVDSVRLGEFHSKNKTDCVEENDFLTECSDPVRDIGVEQVIRHPDFMIGTAINNIALIRLKESVHYSDYIRPICLPIPGTKLLEIGDLLVTSGWGGFQLEEAYYGEIPIKKKVFSALVSIEECLEAFKIIGFRATESHFCTRLLEGNVESKCEGDGGGPVMATRNLQWFQEGIVSFGIMGQVCSGGAYPEIQTNVTHYIDWIVENMRP